jgi:hypothetical protein
MTISESDVIQVVSDRTGFSIQIKAQAEASPPTNTTANILYATSARLQGNFSDFYLEVQDTLVQDLIKIGKTLTDAQTIRAYAYLIGDLQQKKNPDWNAHTINYGGDSLGRDSMMTGYMAAYLKFLETIPAKETPPDDPSLMIVNDSKNYPDFFRLSGLDSQYIDPFQPQ